LLGWSRFEAFDTKTRGWTKGHGRRAVLGERKLAALRAVVKA